MATLVSMASGNFMDANTWRTVLSEQSAELSTVAIGTSYTTAAITLAGAGQTCSGIALKLASSSGSVAGITFTAEIYNQTDATIAAAVTVDKIDMVMPSLASTPTWIIFSFSPITLTAGKTFAIRCKTSTASSVTLYVTAATIHFLYISSTTAAPASGDVLIIGGNLTGAGTGNDVEVTMDNTTSTSFGGIMIGRRGTLRYSTIPGSLYQLVIGGNAMGASSGNRGIEVCNSGLLEIGSALSGMPASATGQIHFDCGSAVNFGLECRNLGRVTIYGFPKLNYSRLSTTASGTATTLQVASNSGWLVNDTIGIAANRRVASQHESRTITKLIGETGVVVSAGLTNVHDGGFNAQGDEVGAHTPNLTRNVKIFGRSVTITTFLNFHASAQVSLQNAEIYWVGSATTSKRGIDVGTTTGTFVMSGCSIRDNTVSSSISCNIVSNSLGVNINNCSFYNLYNPLILGQTTGIATIDSNCFIGTTIGQIAVQLNDVGSVVTNNIISGGTYGLSFNEAGIIANFSGNIIYNMTHSGIYFSGSPEGGTVSTSISFRNLINGIYVNALIGQPSRIIIDSCKAFGNSTSGFLGGTSTAIELNNCTFYGEGGFSTPNGINISTVSSNIVCYNTVFSNHSTGDIASAAFNITNVKMTNCTLSSATEFSGQANHPNHMMTSSHNHDNVVGSHKTFKRFGTLLTDTTVFSRYPPSMKMTPLTASWKLTSEGTAGNPSVYVGTDRSITATVKVRMSLAASGDATTYNGSFPRLVNKKNPGLGITSDAILAIATANASGSFLSISGTTAAVSATGVLEFFVDCDGTTGFVNIDDWSFYQN